MTLNYFEDIITSDDYTAYPTTYTVTRDEIIAFAQKYDPVPFHLDERAAKALGYPTISAPGALTEAIAVRLIHDNLVPIDSYGLLAKDLTLPRPLFAGETVTFHASFRAKRLSRSKPDRGVLENWFKLTTADGHMVYEAKHIVIIKCRPKTI